MEGATFHDGKPITSEDVAFSIETIKAHHPFKTMFGPVEAVETPDARTAVIKLANPHPAILLAMSSALCPILPKHVYGDGQDIATHPANNQPVGSGPFKLVEFKPGEHIVLEKYDGYFLKGRPYLDKIIFRIIPDAANRVIAMETGECQLYPRLTGLRDVQRLQKADGLTASGDGGEAVGALNWLAFNLLKKPFDDKRVRQAIAYAIDRDFIVQKLHLGLTQPATGPIAPGSPFCTDKVNHYDVDLGKANQLLDEAGLKPGADGNRFSMSVDFLPIEPDQQKNIAEYLKSQLKKVGIDVQVRPSPDFPTWLNRVAGWQFDATMDIVFNWGDPVIGVARTYMSSNIRQGVPWSNTQNYKNEKVDELLAQAAVETDQAKRKALYAEFQKIVVENAPIAFINVVPIFTVSSRKLHDLPMGIWGQMSPMDQTYLDK